MHLGPVTFTAGLPGARAVLSWAVLPEHTAQALAVDLGGVEVEVGWIYRPPFGAWTRAPLSHEGWIGETNLQDGAYSVEIETQYGDIDRGVPEQWSHETADPGDLYAEMAQRISERRDIDWPLNLTGEGRRRLLAGDPGG